MREFFIFLLCLFGSAFAVFEKCPEKVIRICEEEPSKVDYFELGKYINDDEKSLRKLIFKRAKSSSCASFQTEEGSSLLVIFDEYPSVCSIGKQETINNLKAASSVFQYFDALDNKPIVQEEDDFTSREQLIEDFYDALDNMPIVQEWDDSSSKEQLIEDFYGKCVTKLIRNNNRTSLWEKDLSKCAGASMNTNVVTKTIAQAAELVQSNMYCEAVDSYNAGIQLFNGFNYFCREFHKTKTSTIKIALDLLSITVNVDEHKFPAFDLSNFNSDTLELARVEPQGRAKFSLPVGEAFELLCSKSPRPGATHELSKYFRRAETSQLEDLFEELSNKCAHGKEWQKLFRTVLSWCDTFECLEAAEQTQLLDKEEIAKMILTRTRFSEALLQKVDLLENNFELKFAAFVNFLPQMPKNSEMANHMLTYINSVIDNNEENQCEIEKKQILAEKGLIDQNTLQTCFHTDTELDRILISGANDDLCKKLSSFYEEIIFYGQDATEIRAKAFLKWMVCPTYDKIKMLENNFEFLNSIQLQAFIKSYVQSIQFSSDPARWYLKPFLFNLELSFDASASMLQSSFVNLHVPTDYHSATLEGYSIFGDSMLPELVYSNASLTFYGQTFDMASLELRNLENEEISLEIGVFGRKLVRNRFDKSNLEKMKELYEWNWWTGDYSEMLPDLQAGDIDLNFNEILLMTDFSIPSIYGEYLNFEGMLVGANHFDFDWSFSSLRGINLLVSSDINVEFNVDARFDSGAFEQNYQISLIEDTKIETELNFALDYSGNLEVYGKLKPPKFNILLQEEPRAILDDNFEFKIPDVVPELVFEMKKTESSLQITVEDFLEAKFNYVNEPFFMDINVDGKFGEKYLHLDSRMGCNVNDCNPLSHSSARLNLKTDILPSPLSVNFLFEQNGVFGDFRVNGDFEYFAEMEASVEYGYDFGLRSNFIGKIRKSASFTSLNAGLTGTMSYAEGIINFNEKLIIDNQRDATMFEIKSAFLPDDIKLRLSHYLYDADMDVGLVAFIGDITIAPLSVYFRITDEDLDQNPRPKLYMNSAYIKKDLYQYIGNFEIRAPSYEKYYSDPWNVFVEYVESKQSIETRNSFSFNCTTRLKSEEDEVSKHYQLSNHLVTKNIIAKNNQEIPLDVKMSIVQRADMVKLVVESQTDEYLMLSYLLRSNVNDRFSTILRANLYIPYLIKLENGYLLINTYKLLTSEHEINIDAKIASVLLSSDPAEYSQLPRSEFGFSFSQENFHKLKSEFKKDDEAYNLGYEFSYALDDESQNFKNFTGSGQISLGNYLSEEIMLDIFNNNNDARLDGVYSTNNSSITFQSAFDKKGIASTGVLSKVKDVNSNPKIRKIGGWQWKFKPETKIGSLQLFHPVELQNDLTKVGDVAAYRMIVNFRKYRRFGRVQITGKSKFPGKYNKADFVGHLNTQARSMNFTLATDKEVQTKIDFAVNDAIELHLVDNVFLPKYLRIDLFFISKILEKKRWSLRGRIGHDLAPVLDCSSTGDVTDTTTTFHSKCTSSEFDAVGFDLQTINNNLQILAGIFGFNKELKLDVNILDDIKKKMTLKYIENDEDLITWKTEGAIDLKNQPKAVISTNLVNNKFVEIPKTVEFESGFRVNELQTSINRIDVASILESLRNFDVEHWTNVAWNSEKFNFRPKIAFHLADDSISARALLQFENTLKNLNSENGIEFEASRGGDSGEVFIQKLSDMLKLSGQINPRSRRSLVLGETDGLVKLNVKVADVDHFIEVSGNGRILRSGQIDMSSLFSTSMEFLENFFGPYLKLNVKGSLASKIIQIALDNRVKRQELELALETSSRVSANEQKIRLRNVKLAQSFAILDKWPREISIRGICQSSAKNFEAPLVEILLDDFSVRCDRLDVKVRKEKRDFVVGLDGMLQRIDNEFQGSVEIKTKEFDGVPNRMKVLITGSDISNEGYYAEDSYCQLDFSNRLEIASLEDNYFLSPEINRHLQQKIACFFVAKLNLQFFKSANDFGDFESLGSGESVVAIANLDAEKTLFQASFYPDEETSEILMFDKSVGSFLIGREYELVSRVSYKPHNLGKTIAYTFRHDFFPSLYEHVESFYEYRTILIKKSDHSTFFGETVYDLFTFSIGQNTVTDALAELLFHLPKSSIRDGNFILRYVNQSSIRFYVDVDAYFGDISFSKDLSKGDLRIIALKSHELVRFNYDQSKEMMFGLPFVCSFGLNFPRDLGRELKTDVGAFDQITFKLDLESEKSSIQLNGTNFETYNNVDINEEFLTFGISASDNNDGSRRYDSMYVAQGYSDDDFATITTTLVMKNREFQALKLVLEDVPSAEHAYATINSTSSEYYLSLQFEPFSSAFNLNIDENNIKTNLKIDKFRYNRPRYNGDFNSGLIFEKILNVSLIYDDQEDLKNISTTLNIFALSDDPTSLQLNFLNNFDDSFDEHERFELQTNLRAVPNLEVSDHLEFDLKGLGGISTVSTECGLQNNDNSVISSLVRCPRFFSRIGKVRFETENGPGFIHWNVDQKAGKMVVPKTVGQKIYDFDFEQKTVLYQDGVEVLAANWDDEEIFISNTLENSFLPFDEMKISSSENGVLIVLDSEETEIRAEIGDTDNFSITIDNNGTVSKIQNSPEDAFKLHFGDNFELGVDSDASGSEFSWGSETTEGSLYLGLGGVELNSRNKRTDEELTTGLRCEITPLNPNCKAWLNEKFVQISSKINYQVDLNQRIKIAAEIMFEQNISDDISDFLRVNTNAMVGVGKQQYFSTGFGFSDEREEPPTLSQIWSFAAKEELESVVSLLTANLTDAENGLFHLESDMFGEKLEIMYQPDKYSAKIVIVGHNLNIGGEFSDDKQAHYFYKPSDFNSPWHVAANFTKSASHDDYSTRLEVTKIDERQQVPFKGVLELELADSQLSGKKAR